MRLFDTIPSNFFSILTGKNKEIYAIALDILYRSLESEEMSILKDDFLRTFRESASDIVMKMDLQEEEVGKDGETEPSSTVSSRAAIVLRRLEETGWIDIQMQNDTFVEVIVLPPYAIRFLEAIHAVTYEAERGYNSLVHSTYSELKLEDDTPDDLMYVTLLRAYENTKRLRIELITLAHSISIYQHKLADLFTTNEVLHDHFDEYKVRILDRLYHPLKTYDSITRFKRPITDILNKWLRSDEVRKTLITQSLLFRREKDATKAEEDLIEKINYIQDMYEQFGKMIAEIDEHQSEYTKASATKIIYLNNNDKSIKGYLESIMKKYASAVGEYTRGESGKNLRMILSGMQDSLAFHEQGYLDTESVSLPVIRKYREEGEPMPIVNTFDEAGELMMQNFLDYTRNDFTDERIYSFMQTAFGGSKILDVADISLPDYDAFVLLILATLRKDDDACFYEVEMGEGYLIHHGYVLPKMKFIRKEKE